MRHDHTSNKLVVICQTLLSKGRSQILFYMMLIQESTDSHAVHCLVPALCSICKDK